MANLSPEVKNVIDALNKARSMELQAIHQYMVQQYVVEGMDYGQLSAYLKLIAIDEMRHAEEFAERVDALGGTPTCENAGPITQGQTIQEIFPFDEGLEANTVKTYIELADICHKNGDPISAGLFMEIIKQEEIHLGYYSDTAKHIKTLGDVFLAKYAATSKHSGPIKSFVKVMEKEKF